MYLRSDRQTTVKDWAALSVHNWVGRFVRAQFFSFFRSYHLSWFWYFPLQCVLTRVIVLVPPRWQLISSAILRRHGYIQTKCADSQLLSILIAMLFFQDYCPQNAFIIWSSSAAIAMFLENLLQCGATECEAPMLQNPIVYCPKLHLVELINLKVQLLAETSSLCLSFLIGLSYARNELEAKHIIDLWAILPPNACWFNS